MKPKSSKARVSISGTSTSALLAALLTVVAATETGCSGQKRRPAGNEPVGPRLEFDQHGNARHAAEPPTEPLPRPHVVSQDPKPDRPRPPRNKNRTTPAPRPGLVEALGSATVSWDRPIRNDDGSVLDNLEGYKIYYGVDPDNLTGVAVGLTSEHTFKGLDPGKYYFSIAAYNAQGVESQRSPPVTKIVAPQGEQTTSPPRPTAPPKQP